MKAQILKMSGCKTLKEFYKKYPSEEAFMKVHGKEFKKAQMGTALSTSSSGFKPISYSDQFDQADKMVTGSTNAERQLALEKQQAAAATQKSGGGSGFDISGLMKMAGSAMGGEGIPTAQFGGNYDLGQTPSSGLNMQQGFPQAQNSFSMQAPKFNAYNPQGDQAGTKMAKGIFEGAHSIEDSPFKTASNMPRAGQIVGAVGDIASAASAFKAERKQLRGLQQQKGVTDVQLQAANSTDIDANRQRSDNFSKQRDAMMQPITGENLFPVNGVGSNVLSKNGIRLQDGGEIQNTYAPDILYDDLGYEPLNDSDIVKAYRSGGLIHAQNGFSSFMGAGGTDVATKLAGNAFGNNAGSQMGSAVGNAVKMIPGVGPVVGAVAAPVLSLIGGGLDQAFGDAGKIKKTQAGLDRNIAGISAAGQTKGIQAQNQSYMEDGGWVSHDWQPQVIASFGDHSAEDVYDYAHEGMNNLRSGGHLRAYTPPSEHAMETYEDGGQIESYALGGELRTTKGGIVKEIAQNDNLPGDGKFVLFNGASHKNGGIDVEFGHAENGMTTDYAEDGAQEGVAKVNVQGGEPGFKDANGNFNVLGALKFMPKVVAQTGDPELMALTKQYGGMKMQNIGKDLASKMNKTNTKLNKTMSELENFTVRTPIDKIKFSGLKANVDGLNLQSKNQAKSLTAITNYQSAINDTRDELRDTTGITYSADRLASHGELEPDKDEVTRYSKFGSKLKKAQNGWYDDHPIAGDELYGQEGMIGGELNEIAIPARQKSPIPIGVPRGTFDVNPQNLPNNDYEALHQDIQLPKHFKKDKHGNPINPDYLKYAMMAYNEALPYIRKSNAKDLDSRQLAGEYNALANNQEEPVQANFYHPELGTPYDINRQTAKNDLISQTRAAQRQVGYNPAAQAMIAAQAYNPMQQLNEADFIANQEMRNRVYGENRNTLNDAKFKNLNIADQQYQRQAQAKANTKATQQDAIASIGNKYLQNALENRRLKTYENMYNYRFDKEGRAINENGLAMLNTEGNSSKGTGGKDIPDGYEYIYNKEGQPIDIKKSSKDKAKNGSIVKSFKNL